MDSCLLTGDPVPTTRPLWLCTEAGLPDLLAALPPSQARWLREQSFQAERWRVLALPDRDGGIAGAVCGLGSLATTDELLPWDAAACMDRLPAGDYHVAGPLDAEAATRFVVGWLQGSYRLAAYRSPAKNLMQVPRLLPPPGARVAYAERAARAASLARDLINAPANELGPAELAAAALQLAARHAGNGRIVQGEELRAQFPLVAAVGQGSIRSPGLIDCRWPRPGAPKVTIVGKGVCFDSGGLDIKPPAAMLLMKKDMGGAACAIGLCELLLSEGVNLELRLLIPAVENSVGGAAFRPGDVWRSRKGLTVEIGNTDAEGRLVLADALAAAAEEQPDLLIDLATLTGAARTALGPELPAIFSADTGLLADLQVLGAQLGDPVWPLPLWQPYDEELVSRIADLNNISASPFAGAIFGALFLQRFVGAPTRWLHIDLYAWNARERPGRPIGAEAQCIRLLHQYLVQRFH